MTDDDDWAGRMGRECASRVVSSVVSSVVGIDVHGDAFVWKGTVVCARVISLHSFIHSFIPVSFIRVRRAET